MNSSLSGFMTSLLEDSLQKHASASSNLHMGSQSLYTAPKNSASCTSLDLITTSAMATDESLPESVRKAVIPHKHQRLKRRRDSLAARFSSPKPTLQVNKKGSQDDSSIGTRSNSSDSSRFGGYSCDVKSTSMDFSASLSNFMAQLLNEGKLALEGDKPSRLGEENREEEEKRETVSGQREAKQAATLKSLGTSSRDIFENAVEVMRQNLGKDSGEDRSQETPRLNKEDLLKAPFHPGRKNRLNDSSSVSDLSSLMSKNYCSDSLSKIDAMMKENKNLSDGYCLVHALAQSSSSLIQPDNPRTRRPAPRKLLKRCNSESSLSITITQDSQSTALLSLSGLNVELKKSRNASLLRNQLTRLQSRDNIYANAVDLDESGALKDEQTIDLQKSGIDTNVDIDTSVCLEELEKSGIDTNVGIDMKEQSKKRRPRSNTPAARRDKADAIKRRTKSASHAKSNGSRPSEDSKLDVTSPGSLSRSPAHKKRATSSSRQRGRTPSSKKERSADSPECKERAKSATQRAKTPSTRKSTRSSAVLNPSARSPSGSRRQSRSMASTVNPSARSPSDSRRQSRSTPSTTEEHRTPSRRRRSTARPDEGDERRDKSKSRRERRTSMSTPGEVSRRGKRTASCDEIASSSRLGANSPSCPHRGTSAAYGDENASTSISRMKSPSSRSKRTSRTTRKTSPSDRGKRSGDSDVKKASHARSGSPSARVKRSGSPSIRSKRSGSPRGTRAKRSGSPSARAKGRDSPSFSERRPGSPTARGKRSSTVEPRTPSNRKRTGSPSTRTRHSSMAESGTPSIRKRAGSPSDRGTHTTLEDPKIPSRRTREVSDMPKNYRSLKDAQETSSSSDQLQSALRTQQKNKANSDESGLARPKMRRVKTIGENVPFPSAYQRPPRRSNTTEAVPILRRQSKTQSAAMQAEGTPVTNGPENDHKIRTTSAEGSKPTNRRKTSHRNTVQAQEVLRQALAEDVKVQGVKEEAWISRRKNRMINAVQAQQTSERGGIVQAQQTSERGSGIVQAQQTSECGSGIVSS